MTAPLPLHDRPGRRWPSASLSVYLVAVLLLATVPIAALMSYQIFSTLNTQQERLQQELLRSATALAQTVERELASSVDTLTLVSQADALQQEDVAGFERIVGPVPRLKSNWRSVYLLDRDGRVLLDTAVRNPLDSAPADTAARPPMALSRQAVVSNLLGGAAPGSRGTLIEVPVIVRGELRYVFGARFEKGLWQRLVERAGVPAGGFLTVYDREHRIIARTLAPEQSIGRLLPQAAVASMGARPAGVHRAAMLGEGTTYAAWHTVPLSGWGVGAGVPAEPVDQARMQSMLTALATALACLLAGVTLALLVARRVTLPLRELSTKGAAQSFAHIPVREISLLRDALVAAQAHDEVARERLQAKADECETLFGSSPIGLAFAQDPQCRVVQHNAAMDELFGPPGPDGPGALEVRFRGRKLERSEQPLQRAAARGETVSAMELEIVADGRPPTFVLAHAVPLLDAKGRPRGAIGAVVDITERKLTEARLISADRRLRESQRLVDLAQEAGHVGFFHYQFENDALAWTPGQAKLFGIHTRTFEGTLDDWVRRIEPEDRVRVEAGLRELLAARRPKETLEFRVCTPQGPPRWLSSRVLVNYADDGRPMQMIGVTLDMTDQKTAEAERAALIERAEAARVEAETANRAKDEFLAMLGHELRNPLSAISSAVEVLNRVDSASPTALNARNIIARQTRHLAHLMGDLLDVARVISGKILLSRGALDLAALVQRVVATMQVTGASAEHDLHLSLHETWIDADATRIEQVVSNLLTNALKYTPAGGRIDVRVGLDADQAVLEVRDTGMGIPSHLLPRIFDLFVQGERALDRRAGGLGIGLTLVRRLVELHGGTIGVESDSSGSVFRMRMPAVDAPVRPREEHFVPESRRRRVMVIEDNEDALEALRSMLELDGHRVWAAGDGDSGLGSLLEVRPDVAVVDIGLPGLTGYEVARRSRAAGYTGRMIAVSGYGQASDIRAALAAGFDAHLAKPVDSSELRRLLADE